MGHWVFPIGTCAKSQQVGEPLYYNSLMSSGSDSHGLYKNNVVPFGEYIPLSGMLKWVLPACKNDISMSGFSRGEANPSH